MASPVCCSWKANPMRQRSSTCGRSTRQLYEGEPILLLAAPHAPQVHSVLGAALVGLGRYQEGLEALDRALDLTPGDPDPMYNKACAYSLMHEGEQALEWLKQAILMYPPYKDKACKDPHFANLKKSLEWAPQFQDLVG